MKLQPMNGFCMVRVGRTADRTSGGLYIPDKAQTRPTVGVVEAASLDYENDHGFIVKTNLKVGQTVLFNKFAGEAIESSDPGLLIAKERDVLGIIQGE